MSPEQAQSKTIDARSDLFSFGVILYELATGRRPFTGDTGISIIASIVKDTPSSVTELNASLPRELGRIIRRSLAKDLDRRYQTAKDLRNDLEELKASLDSGELNPEAPAATEPKGKRLRLPIVAGAGIVAAVARPGVRSVGGESGAASSDDRPHEHRQRTRSRAVTGWQVRRLHPGRGSEQHLGSSDWQQQRRAGRQAVARRAHRRAGGDTGRQFHRFREGVEYGRDAFSVAGPLSWRRRTEDRR
jgi:serine/threonine protein kinase